MEIKVRLATENDAEALARLNQEFNGGDKRPSLEIIESLDKSNELIAVAEMAGKVVAFAAPKVSSRFVIKSFREK